MELDRDQAVYPIAVAAQQVGMSARTLRIYEQEGLLRPPASRRRPAPVLRTRPDLDPLHLRTHPRPQPHHGRHKPPARSHSLLGNQALPGRRGRPLRALPEYPRHGNAFPQPAPRPQVPSAEAALAEAEGGAVEVKIFYGIKEFGVIFPCLKCIQAERIARRIADRHPGRVVVRKYDALSEEADRHGVMMTPDRDRGRRSGGQRQGPQRQPSGAIAGATPERGVDFKSQISNLKFGTWSTSLGDHFGEI